VDTDPEGVALQCIQNRAFFLFLVLPKKQLAV